ncbi:MAG: DUF5058 family protein [Ruminococcaceae bacterium]|nr:DUF5058 family protein [Oscillospiraceae bacterium]
MEFSINHPLLFVLAGIIVLIVLAQSVFFLLLAWRRGVKMGMEKKKLRRIAVSAAVFTIAPAIAIIISIATLSKDLGLPLPWLRLSVVGSQSYETIAAQNTLSAMGSKLGGGTVLNASAFVTIALVMTISIMVGIWLVPVVAKKMQKGMITMEKRDKKWSDIFNASMFIGMIAAFLGFVFCDFGSIFKGETYGLTPVLVMIVSALTMVLAGLLVRLTKWRWINDYALPVSLVVGMASAIPITAWLGVEPAGEVAAETARLLTTVFC